MSIECCLLSVEYCVLSFEPLMELIPSWISYPPPQGSGDQSTTHPPETSQAGTTGPGVA